jgi:type IV secretory pathway TraG/TraD family ATPase VirD4
MASKLNTFFSGTVGPRGDRPGPDGVLARLGLYLLGALLFPVAIVVYGIWLSLFTYARLPWWVPTAAGVTLVAGALLTGTLGPAGVEMYWGALVAIWSSVGANGDLFAALGDNLPALLLGQIWLSLVLATSWAGIVTGWKYARRPRHEEKFLTPGPVLWKRWRKTAEDIARGTDSPKSGLTLGIAQDTRHPWYAGGAAGERFGSRVVLTDKELAAHALVIGASGGGKTMGMLSGIRDAIRQGRPVVFIDCKGDNEVAERIHEWSQRYGREFLHWSIFDQQTTPYEGPADKPAFYDPISRGDPSRRKELLMGAFLWESPYYKNIIENFLQILFRVQDLVPPLPGQDYLSDTAMLLEPEALVRRARYIDRLEQAELTDSLARAAQMGPQERSGIASMWSRINTLTASTAGQWLRADPDKERDIDFGRVAHEGQVVVFTLPGNMYPELSSLVAGLIIQDLKTAGQELLNEPAPLPFHVYVDEFGVIESSNILGLLQRARASKMPCMVATQSLADLARHDPTFPNQVIDTVSLFLIHRVNSEHDARTFAGLSGIAKKTVERVAIEKSSGIFGTVGATTATGGGYVEERDDYVIPVGAFQKLRELEGILIAKGSDRYLNTYYVIPEDAEITKVKAGYAARHGRAYASDAERDRGIEVHRPGRRASLSLEQKTYPHPSVVEVAGLSNGNVLDVVADNSTRGPAAPAPTQSPPARTGATRPHLTSPPLPAQGGAAAGAPLPGVGKPAGAPLPMLPVEASGVARPTLPMVTPPAPARNQNPEEWGSIP